MTEPVAGKAEPVAGKGPLAGLRVLDLTRLLPGPVATMHLADLGAEVIKIEDTGPGDYARAMGPGEKAVSGTGGNSGDSVFFRLVNRNKKSLRLDLKQAAGVAAFLRLAKDADVIFESFRPGVVDKLGIGYAAVKAINPRVVYCAITGYGQTGPWAELAGHDINYLATSGLLEQIGHHDGQQSGPPAIPNLQVGDLLGGALTPLLGVLAAVIGAKATGQGSHVDVAMTDAVLAHNIFPAGDHAGLRQAGTARRRPADRRRALLWRVPHGRRPLPGGGRAGAEVLAGHVRRAESPGPVPLWPSHR
jgi:alpha-methylacyl-CoA racemase